MKQKILSAVLALALVLSLLPTAALADGSEDVVDAAPDMAEEIVPSEEAGAESESSRTGVFAAGTGTQEDPYEIADLDQLKAFRDSVNGGESYRGKYIQLTADIDLENEEWEPIGGTDTGEAFSGTFDGDGHIISNLKITRGLENTAANNKVGLFGACANPAKVQNMTLENVDVQGSLCVGAVLGDSQTSNSAISNVHVTGSVRVYGWWYVGGIMGKGYGTVTGCSVEGDGTDTSYVKITGGYAGGIVGFMGEGNSVTADCSVKSLTVEGLYNGIGGINGILHYGNTIRDCTAEDVVVWQTTSPDAEEERIYCGAFAGTFLVSGGTPTLRDCTFTGALYSGPEKTDILEPTRYVGSLWYGAEPPADVNIENCTIHMRPVAQVGSETYLTLSEALEAAESGDTVKLLADVALTGGSGEGKGILTIAGKAITLDGAGHVLTAAQGVVTGSSMINVQYTAVGTVTIKDLTIDSSGLAKHGINLNGASVSLENVRVKDGTGYGVVCNGSTLSVDGLTTSGNAWGGINVDATAGTGSRLTVKSAVLNETGSVVFENKNGKSVSAGISGGTFQYVLVHPTQATHLEQISVSITGGAFEGLSNISSADPDKAAAMTVSGGIFTDDPTPYLAAGHRAEQADGKYRVYPVRPTVTFDANGGSVTPANTITGENGKLDSLPTPTRIGYTFNGWFTAATGGTKVTTDTVFTTDTTVYAQWTAIQSGGTGGGSSSSGSGSTSSGDKTETEKNPDGSTTTIVTKPDGSKTETTKNPDGSQQVVSTDKTGNVTTTATDAAGNKTETVEKTDGTSQTTVTNKDGSSSTTKVDETGKTEAEVRLPDAVVNDAAGNGEAVTLPMPSVSATADGDGAPTVTVTLPGSSTSAKVEIPVENVTPGTVAVIVHPDGTEEIIKNTLATESGVAVTLSDGETVKIVDNTKTFDDVGDAHWSADAVTFVSSRELFQGTSETTFDPDTAMSRGMIVTVLARFDGVDTSGGSSWYEAGMQWAVEAGISDGSGMDQSLTREQLATMLYRYAGSPAVTGSVNTFPDAGSVSGFAADAMAWAVENGLISGMGDGTLAPQGQATRAQVAAILQRFVAHTA